MAKRVIYVGVATNDGKGDTLKVGAQKINDNFTELYTALGADTGSLSVVSGLVAGDGITVSSQAGLVTVTSKVATDTVLGGVKIGDNLNITEDGVLSANAGNYSLPVATGGTLGGVKVTGNDGIAISGTGVISVTPYSLPTATDTVLGGIKVGSRLTITNGVLSATDQSYTLPKATDHSLGGVIVDNTTIAINSNGVISAIGSATGQLVNDVHEVILNANGNITYPGNITQSYQDNTTCSAGVDTVIYTGTNSNQHAIKLFVMVEGTPDGGTSWETQACDIIAVKGFVNDIVHVTAYGITYSSASAFAEFDGQWNATTNRIEITCRPTSLTNNVVASVHAIEMTTND